ncbi:ubiquitin-conjugating enzyme E2 C-like [Phyllostomus hastatus]|uniref:ubiquitin-conjugating enzyme E2 C-like n=1 Tax=Phyllostomus hastatus TaxID=9423 RepID=UPI001E67FD06|nr:ubiquitin-conjugating enzyme E2 C-like [Phyllostomus hastatus]
MGGCVYTFRSTAITTPQVHDPKMLQMRTAAALLSPLEPVGKRMVGKLQQLMTPIMPGDKGIFTFPNRTTFQMGGAIPGTAVMVREDLRHKLSLELPCGYLCRAPTAKFLPSCYNPSADTESGTCLDALKDGWSAPADIRTGLLSTRSLRERSVNRLLSTQAAEHGKNLAALERYL